MGKSEDMGAVRSENVGEDNERRLYSRGLIQDETTPRFERAYTGWVGRIQQLVCMAGASTADTSLVFQCL